MKAENNIIFVGSVNLGGVADDGETMKNRILIRTLEKYVDNVIVIDVRHRARRVIYLLKLVVSLIIRPHTKVVFSASSLVTYKLLKITRIFNRNRPVFYWVIGGTFGELIEQECLKSKYYTSMKCIMVEGDSMNEQLVRYGFDNVITIPNFKVITYVPQKVHKNKQARRFVFLSRIIPEKGVDLILEAVKCLNNGGIEGYEVDFYGKIDDEYRRSFLERIETLRNVHYKGFLDLTVNDGYDTLASYDVMLFPTFWKGEGFPGIIIDAYIAGLPVIASDWNLNKSILHDGRNGLIIPSRNIEALADAMRACMDGNIDIAVMSSNAQADSVNFDVDSVITRDLLNRIGII